MGDDIPARFVFQKLYGICSDFFNVNAMKFLFWSAVINGVAAVPIMAAMMLVVARGNGAFQLPRWVIGLGWLATTLMLVTVGAMLWSSLA